MEEEVTARLEGVLGAIASNAIRCAVGVVAVDIERSVVGVLMDAITRLLFGVVGVFVDLKDVVIGICSGSSFSLTTRRRGGYTDKSNAFNRSLTSMQSIVESSALRERLPRTRVDMGLEVEAC